MTDPEKTYILTFRQDAPQPAGWQQKLAQTPGITLISTTGRYARIKGNPAAMQKALAMFGDDVILEEELPRYF